MTDWKPTTELPSLSPGDFGYKECRNLIVWIDEPTMRGFAKGSCYVPPGSHPEARFSADGFNGRWNITHWAYVTTPEGKQGGDKP